VAAGVTSESELRASCLKGSGHPLIDIPKPRWGALRKKPRKSTFIAPARGELTNSTSSFCLGLKADEGQFAEPCTLPEQGNVTSSLADLQVGVLIVGEFPNGGRE
jgi:hypothetical protein